MNNKIDTGLWDSTWLAGYLDYQLNNFFPDNENNINGLLEVVPLAVEKLYTSLSYVKIESHQVFSYLHSDLYAQFLYFVSNTAWKLEKLSLAQKVFYLNKSLHAINCSYSTQLPDKFIFLHIVGTVLGKAKYNDFLVINQNVTVGSVNGFEPIIGKGVLLRPNSKVIGKSTISDFSSLSINACVFNEHVPESTVVIGSSPNLILKKSKKFLVEDIFFFS